MTKRRYQTGCAAGSTRARVSVSPRSTRGRSTSTMATRTGITGRITTTCAGAAPVSVTDPSFRSLRAARRRALKGKRPSMDMLRFEHRWPDRLLDLEEQLRAGTWAPSAPTVRIARHPKVREIHAPPFADRVAHHWAVPPLEAEYEPVFIHDSYSNRVGKGTHAAVRRLLGFVRQVDSGQGGGFYLQLDIKNFFPSIHRPTLYRLLRARMERAGLPIALRRAVHALCSWSTRRTGVRWACTPAERQAVPAHKRLENAAPGCGLAIGNLSSQFFANVYLHALDCFVKHVLKAKRYLRYVDDFVLIHRSREQLLAWRDQIEAFLRDTLRLELKAEQKLRPLRDGIDFLGYVVRPTHVLVRRRVVAHCRAKLAAFERGEGPRDADRLRAVWASYCGHFRHASSWRLQARIHDRFPWLRDLVANEAMSYG